MAQRRREVAPCGNHCAACPAHLPLAHNDALGGQAMAAVTNETSNDRRSADVGCEGCWGMMHNARCASLACRIRRSVSSKGFATCAECPDFPCQDYLRQFAEDSEQARNIRAIKAQGLDAWLAGKERRLDQPTQAPSRGKTRLQS